jgi:hypothetical protein
MWLVGFYRFYFALTCGIVFYVFAVRSIWLAVLVAALERTVWFAIERLATRISTYRDFKRHVYSFKQQLGPYGIRVANQAENDFRTKKSLAEVFVSNPARLKKNVEQLKMMDTLFQAGMRPDGDAYLLHDCKLKYGAFRVEQLDKPA